MTYYHASGTYPQPEFGYPGIPEPPKPWWKRGSRKFYQGIVAVGAIVTAITAVVTFRLPHDVQDTAAITATAATGVRLNEYKEHTVPLRAKPASMRRVAQVEVSIGATSQNSSKTGSPMDTTAAAASPTAETQGSNVPSMTSAPTVTGVPTASGPPTATDVPTDTTGTPKAAMVLHPFAQAQAAIGDGGWSVFPQPGLVSSQQWVPHVLKKIVDVGNTLSLRPDDVGVVAQIMASSVLTDASAAGKPAAKTTAERVRELKDMRTAKVKGSRKRQLVGVVVSANVEVSGLRGKEVMLSWSMWQTGGDQRVYGAWLNERLAYRLKATTDDDTASLDFWVPLPRTRGPYIIRARLAYNGDALAAGDTQPFS
jgi:hypothetical protein